MDYTDTTRIARTGFGVYHTYGIVILGLLEDVNIKSDRPASRLAMDLAFPLGAQGVDRPRARA